ncbi:adhesion G-protein coupled receptor G1 [Etheostoma cragini]|uniref:adhesion G-protein coupled receptor G1 n=1 Tax=Etheostoma cragini TaxID=417921 RepID=UPI00155F0999|nr:adhesion G-protein coupled receptor G1 [Etheostoma cragini]
MEPRLRDNLRVVFVLIFFSAGSSEHDLDWKFCGRWRHGKAPLMLDVNLTPGCSNILVLANRSSLSINGQITAQCRRSDMISLRKFGLESQEETQFCLYWEPLLDQLKLQLVHKKKVREENLIICQPARIQGNCCTDLSQGPNTEIAAHGIKDGMVNKDFITDKIMTAYSFQGDPIKCKKLCDQQSQGSSSVTMASDTVRMSRAQHHCALSSEVEMKEDSTGYNVTAPATRGVSTEITTTVYLPPALKRAAKLGSKVVCTFFKNNSLFQDSHKHRILDDVVEITVENEVIINLSEPVRIGFHHDKMQSRRCVSWDTRTDPFQVNWLEDGCKTEEKGAKYTECLCNHLTYFTVLVQMKPRPVRHLLALTAITSLGCAVSVISCVALIVYLCRKSKRSKEHSVPIHFGLAASLVLLNLLFFLTGVLANVGGESVCPWVGAGLHYALLSSFTWMGIEVFHTFWLVYMVFIPPPKPYVWNLVGFVLPALPIIILAAIGDIYGVRKVVPSDDVSNPYLMCWMKENHEALLAHYFTTMTILVVLVFSGIVMLFLVYKEIRTRDEWKQNRVAFLSIWGLSCLFGTTWGLTFLDFGPLSDFVLFLSCILNSFQGFFLMLRFCIVDWIRKQAGGSGLGSTSTGSTRQHMLQPQEKS